MTYTILLFSFSILSTISFLTYILARGDRGGATGNYIIYLTFALLWQTGDLILSLPVFPLQYAETFAKLHAFAWMPIPFIYLHFIYVFLNKKRDIYLWINASFLPVAILIISATDLYISEAIKEPWGISIIVSKTALPFTMLILMITPCYGIYVLLSYYKILPVEKRYQINNLLVGTLFLLIFGVFISVVLRDIMGMEEVPPLASTLVVIQSGFALRAMLKHQLLQPRISEMLDNVLYKISEGIILLDARSKVIASNLKAKEILFQFSPDLSLSEQFIPPFPPGEFNNKRFTLKHDTDRTFLITQNSINRKGENIGWLIILNEITTRVSLEQSLIKGRNEAIQATHFKSRALANLSHEFKTPLNIILGYTQLLQQLDNLTPDQQQQLSRIATNGSRLLTLLNNLLKKAKDEYIPQNGGNKK